MTEPATSLDSRFSGPGATATDWAEASRVLDEAQISWITTVRPDGRPHVTPLVAVWLDGVLYFGTGAEEQKAVNLSANPHVVLTTGRNEWDRGVDVIVEGDADRVTDTELLGRLATAWAGKWDGQWQFTVNDDGTFGHPDGSNVALVYGVRPTKVLSFGREGGFSHTRHRF